MPECFPLLLLKDILLLILRTCWALYSVPLSGTFIYFRSEIMKNWTTWFCPFVQVCTSWAASGINITNRSWCFPQGPGVSKQNELQHPLWFIDGISFLSASWWLWHCTMWWSLNWSLERLGQYTFCEVQDHLCSVRFNLFPHPQIPLLCTDNVKHTFVAVFC